MKSMQFLVPFLALWGSLSVVEARPTAATQEELTEDLTRDLLASLFRQTIYQRMENLLLDPGHSPRRDDSEEKGKIVESAVENYHRQTVNHPEGESAEDITKFAGFWIRSTTTSAPEPIEGPKMLASTQLEFAEVEDDPIFPPSIEANSESEEVSEDKVTEPYDIHDLFAEAGKSISEKLEDIEDESAKSSLTLVTTDESDR